MCAKKKHADLLQGQMVMKITWNISINLIPYIFLNAIFIVYDALFYFTCRPKVLKSNLGQEMKCYIFIFLLKHYPRPISAEMHD